MVRLRMFGIAAGVLAATMFGNQAQAGWGSFGGSYGSSGGYYGSSGGGSYGSSGGSYGSYRVSYYSGGSSGSSGSSGGGLFGHLRQKIAHHRAARYSSSGGSSGGSYGSYRVSSYGSSGGSSGYQVRYSSSSGGSSGYQSSYSAYRGGGSSGTSVVRYSAPVYSAPVYSYSAPVSYGSNGGGYGSSGGGVTTSYSSPVYQETPIYSSPAAPIEHQHSAPSTHGNSIIETPVEGASYRYETHVDRTATEAMLTMHVPAEAKIFVNGKQTRSTGTSRQFVSGGLKPGYSYAYTIRIETPVDGRVVTETKQVHLRAGDTHSLAYSAPASQATPVIAAKPVVSQPMQDTETVLTVNVPEDANVILAGNSTSADGSTRVFRTNQLKPGEVWNDYVIMVQVKRGDQMITKQKSITLTAGSQPEVTFDFAESTVAMR